MGAGNIYPGPEGFENIVSDPADKKIPRNIQSEPSTQKRLVECGENQRLLKKKQHRCVETQEEKEGKYVRVTLEGRAKSNYPN